MAFPFPGMDPYLEMQPFWSDFSPKFLTAISNQLLDRLLPRYDVRIEEYLFVMHEDVRLRRVSPDVTVVAAPDWQPESATATAVADPATVELEYPDIEPRKQRHLKIIRREDERVVTVMELLSPTNKRLGEDGIEANLEKRAELVSSRVNLVEIDLLRGGERLPMRGPLPLGDYYVYVGRVGRKPRWQVLGWPLRMALPVVPIPLLPDDQETELDLAAAFRTTYESAFFDRRLPYDQPLEPKPNDTDGRWIQQLLKQ